MSAGYARFNVNDKNGNLPSYSTEPWSIGPTFGIELLPFTMSNGGNLGFQMEMHRSGQQAYKDFYNTGDMPGLSYFKFGVTWRLQ